MPKALAAFAASGRRRPSAARTHTLTPSLSGDQWRARAIAGALSLAQNSTFRRARSSVHDTPRAHLRARFPPRPARDSQTPARDDSPAAIPALFFQLFDDRGGTDMQHARGIPNATCVHLHVDDLLLDGGGVTGVAVLHQESAPVACRLLATIALLGLAGLPMSDDIGPLAVRAMQDLHNHAITRVAWGLLCGSYPPRE